MTKDDGTTEHDDELKPIGQLIDTLGIATAVTSDELVSGAIVLLKVIQADGTMRITVAHSDGLGWIERAGMLRVVEHMEVTGKLSETY